ncbi:MAG: hypothetical protein RSA26_00735 [Mucinivorans sp.]
MNTFNSIVASPELAQEPKRREYLRKIVHRYPYFTLARLLCEPLETLSGELAGQPYPSLLLYSSCDQAMAAASVPPMSSCSSPMPQEVVNEDLAAPFMTLDDGAISETLAAIYAAQGQKELSRDIYLKLSLKNPEKSRYFVSLIEKL